MLSEKAYINPAVGVWGNFERVREQLNRQEAEPGFIDGSGLAPEDLKAGFFNLREKLAHSTPVIRKAKLCEYLLLNARIAIDPNDWFADKLDHQNLMRDYNGEMMVDVPLTHIKKESEKLAEAIGTGYFKTQLDVIHVAPGWGYMLEKGISGLLKEASLARIGYGELLTAEQKDFYDALEIVYSAVLSFAHRLSSTAASLVGTSGEAADVRLLTMANSLKKVPEKPPEDFHEALQFAYIMHQVIEMESDNSAHKTVKRSGVIRSMGGFDRHYYKYYRKDFDLGRLTRENAQELVKFFFTKFFAHTQGASSGKNFCFGGKNQDGTNAENELTYIALEAYKEMRVPDPKLSVRFHGNSSERLYELVAETIRSGSNSFVLVNDEIAIPTIAKYGKTLEEAQDYLLIGCFEPAIEGKEISCSMSTHINMAKSVELVLNRGVDIGTGAKLGPDTGDPCLFTSYEEFEKAFFLQLHAQTENAVEILKKIESLWPLMNPSPMLAGTFEDALKSGKDIGQSGPKYNNSGCMGSGLGTTVDSLSAVKKAVFKDGVCSMSELISAIKDNYQGHEKLQIYLQNSIPRWGNAIPEVDDIGKRIADAYCDQVNMLPNGRGGRMLASMFSLTEFYYLGRGLSALPDGRKKDEPISLNNIANAGKDKEGVTALIQSLTKIDYSKIPNGSVTDVYLHPSAVSGEEGLKAMIALIKTYFKRGGFGVQFNIFSTDDLIEAQKHPEKYQTLQIRVCGWNVYFVTLSPYEQEQYIKANIHSA